MPASPPCEPISLFAKRCDEDEEEGDDAKVDSFRPINVEGGPDPTHESDGEDVFARVLGEEAVPRCEGVDGH
eukprot:CAMPEP_0183710638 /NCGR_PEP_ID=MMETSP0737-20130205/6326_1 /TAXON_ID=385413 /ORGANISM="Thalassiosira miniscula, Strain CCMP1093" /LENGTH=71 /DNA_ID=CAMNT_0025938957 /DNA_START=441 /DNA_END=657 /DNA_ORIENTATION=+